MRTVKNVRQESDTGDVTDAASFYGKKVTSSLVARGDSAERNQDTAVQLSMSSIENTCLYTNLKKVW